MANIEAVISSCVDDLWQQYDTDDNGCLDKQETKRFIRETLKEMGGQEFTDEEFETIFQEFDKDGNGTIEKDEMAIFIRKVAGL